MKLILKKSNKYFIANFINKNKNIYFFKIKKSNFILFFEKIKKIFLFFKKMVFFNKKNYNGYFKKIINYINLIKWKIDL
ncbi:hypothetical protein [Candidatus Carsonella ruddii]|uniref:Uncharacterized protein n=1 Tax=Carsonella ruddii TaxID=114186 RepID=A0AAE7KMA9_CARRU|nr:hypothetical protein [Candidatus Carsonella ruddii]AGS06658.1 hypothetical protein CRDC_00870 [Candidatus Carsonella ruddii DC]ALA96893.1 hypothetical protein AMC76_00915 [Candidatus Carsonella ruddii]QLK14131.1 hypothetical protein FK493_00925 [Candidatus Carsonella ruddii]